MQGAEVSIRAWHCWNWPCEKTILPTWFARLELTFTYEGAQFKMSCPLVKTNCPSAENVTETLGTECWGTYYSVMYIQLSPGTILYRHSMHTCRLLYVHWQYMYPIIMSLWNIFVYIRAHTWCYYGFFTWSILSGEGSIPGTILAGLKALCSISAK